MPRSLAARFGVEATVLIQKTCLDPRVQWRQMANIRYNAALSSALYQVSRPVRRLAGLVARRPRRLRRTRGAHEGPGVTISV